MKYKAFLFDMDGVITETNHQHYIAWKELAKEIGIDIDLEFNENLKGTSRRDSLLRILEYGNRKDDFSKEEFEEMLTKKNENYLSLIEEFTGENLFEGVEELLIKLKESGIKRILTSASKNAPHLLELLGIKDLFDGVVNPAEVKGKPNPDIFLKGAQIAGVPPGECIGVEDAQSGIDAIKAAEMEAIAIGHHLKKADYYFKTPKELLDNLDKFL